MTVETASDEDDATRHPSRWGPGSTGTDGIFRVDPNHRSQEINNSWPQLPWLIQDRVPHPRKIYSVGDSSGAAHVEELLAGLQRSWFSHTSRSIERVLCEHADQAEEHTQMALRFNRRALELLVESLESTKEAQTKARQAHERLDDLLSVSSQHRKRAHARECAERESLDRVMNNAQDRYCKQADFECWMRSDVLTPEEHLGMKPSPVSSWRL